MFKMPKLTKSHNSEKNRRNSFKHFSRYLVTRFHSDFFMGHNSRKVDNSDKKKGMGQLFFHEESMYEISKPSMHGS